MSNLRVFLDFIGSSDHHLEETAGCVLVGLYPSDPQGTFPTPPFSEAFLQSALTTFTNAIAAQKQGGTAATAQKNVAKAALVNILRQDAMYVQSVVQAVGDPAEALARLLSTGYKNASTNRAQTALPPPAVKGVTQSGSGQVRLAIGPVSTAKAYQVQYKNGTDTWTAAGPFTSSRKVVVTSLTPGSMYTF